MALSWITPPGSLGSINERDRQEITLLATSTQGPVTFSLQAGSLPRGLRLEENKILGTPFEVSKPTTTRFVIRAFDGSEKKDRTFSISVGGYDEPKWVTTEGLLPVGPNSTFFVLDNDKVDFQLMAMDPDMPAGDTIEYYIPYNGGELPPGLTLSRSGRITGFTDPIFALEYKIYSGNYDLNLFDSEPYDLGTRPINGFDSFSFDERTFDYFDETGFPRRLTRYYQFTVVATDGLFEDRRTFQIYVVSEDFLRSDNTIMQVGTGIFRADNTYVRQPIWITEPDLGQRRANNYVTIYLDVFDPPSMPGYISYRFEIINPEFSGKTVRIFKDESDYIEVDMIPDIKGVTGLPRKNQKFSVANVYNFLDSTLGTYTILNVEKIDGYTDRYGITFNPSLGERVIQNAEIIFGNDSALPPGLDLDTITGELVGSLPYQPRITKDYKFTVSAVNTYDNGVSASTPRTFSLRVLGEIESGIVWISDRDLGSISPNKDSMIFVEALSKLNGGNVFYQLRSGQLPPGLRLLPSGEIYGKVNQIGTSSLSGITRFYNNFILVTGITGTFTIGSVITGSNSQNTAKVIAVDSDKIFYKDLSGNFIVGDVITATGASATFVSHNKDFTSTTYDSNLTSFDRVYTFVIEARDILNYTESAKTFQITVQTQADIVYSNLYFKAYQKKSKRELWNNFISDFSIFTPEKIYRYGDPAFGVQDEIKMLMFAGIESNNAETFIQALSRNHYFKRLNFGSIKKAVAKDTATQSVMYEIIYVEIVDPLIKKGKSISNVVTLSDNINSRFLVNNTKINVSSDIPLASDRDHQRVFPNSIKNMRKRIKQTGIRDRSYLPLWMRSIQEDQFAEPGFVSAMPLCFAKPGQADDIILNIQKSGFDFKVLDFEVDRYIIDALDREIEDKYLAFPTFEADKFRQ